MAGMTQEAAQSATINHIFALVSHCLHLSAAFVFDSLLTASQSPTKIVAAARITELVDFERNRRRALAPAGPEPHHHALTTGVVDCRALSRSEGLAA